MLVFDIGNSNVVIGWWTGNEWKQIWRLPTNRNEDAILYYGKHISELIFESELSHSGIDRIVVCSVVPDLNAAFAQIIPAIFNHQPIFISPQEYKKLSLDIDHPSEIGTDLACNAIAAVTKYQSDSIIVDFGTALTFTSVTKEMRILGVAIAPGLKTSIKALHGNTAQLPEVPLLLPDTIIGKNTTHAIQSGILWGYVGLVKEVVARTKAEMTSETLVIATGGLSSILYPLKDYFDHIDRNLTLDGIRILGGL